MARNNTISFEIDLETELNELISLYGAALGAKLSGSNSKGINTFCIQTETALQSIMNPIQFSTLKNQLEKQIGQLHNSGLMNQANEIAEQGAKELSLKLG